MKTILITGAAGYIASHTIAELDPGLYEVVAIDNHCNSSPEVYQQIEQINPIKLYTYNVDLRNSAALREVFKSHPRIDGIIHFAALKSVPESISKPIEYFENNVGGMLNLLKMAKEYSVKTILFSSSCSVYGCNAIGKLNESTPLGKALSPYAYTKQIGEQLLNDYASEHNSIKALSLRYFNPAGYHVSGLLGETTPDESSSMIPILCRKVNQGEAFEVFGSDYPTRDGTCIRDFIHVSDIAKAHVLGLNYLFEMEHTYSDQINLGTGTGHSILEVIRAMEKTLHLPINRKLSARREGDVIDIYADNEKAKKLLNWTAQHGLNDIISSAWNFWSQLTKQHAA